MVDPATHDLYATSSNGPFDGSANWADTVLELSPGAGRLLRHYTPPNQQQLEARTATSAPRARRCCRPAAQPRYLLQGGKDGVLRLLPLPRAFGAERGRGPAAGSARRCRCPAGPDVFTATRGRTPGRPRRSWRPGPGRPRSPLAGGRLRLAVENGSAGTSPVLAGGLLWVYDPPAP